MKTIGIEALLRWAYCEELPKAEAIGGAVAAAGPRQPGNHWGRSGEMRTLLAIVDAEYNRFGVVSDPLALEAPHADAVVVGDVVAELSTLELDLPDGWCPLGDFVAAGALTEGEAAAATVRGLARVMRVDTDGHRGAGERLARLVMRHAVQGGAPDWEAEVPERKVVSAHGKPRWFRMTQVWSGAVDGAGHAVEGMGRWVDVEVDGYDEKRKRARPDAYRKHYFDPDPADAVVARAEYQLWRAALAFLAVDLDGRLADHAVTDSSRGAAPWIDGEGAADRRPVVHLARPWSGDVAVSGEKRPRALGPLSRPAQPAVRLPLDSAAVA